MPSKVTSSREALRHQIECKVLATARPTSLQNLHVLFCFRQKSQFKVKAFQDLFPYGCCSVKKGLCVPEHLASRALKGPS